MRAEGGEFVRLAVRLLKRRGTRLRVHGFEEVAVPPIG